MKINLEDIEDIRVNIDFNDCIQTHGGEYTLYGNDGEAYDDHIDYGIQFIGDDESISFGGMSISQYTEVGLSIINHLMANGHRFEINDSRDGNGEYLTIKH